MLNLTRRSLLKLAAAAPLVKAKGPVSLFNGRDLDGWIDEENSATSFSGSAIPDPGAFLDKLKTSPDPLSTYFREQIGDVTPATLVKALNKVVGGASIYDRARFQGIVLRPETARLAASNPHGFDLERLNKLLIEDAYPRDLLRSSPIGWTVKDGAMASTGAGRGVLYTAQDFSRFRLSFTMRHVSGNPDHQACVLIFCRRPEPGQKPLDALAGIQFQVPNGGHWDYRPGKNNNGGAEFTTINKTHFDVHSWSRVEIAADAANGTARMSVAQPPGSEPVEVLAFTDPTAGRSGPIAWQMHNAGLFDEYKDVEIESAADER